MNSVIDMSLLRVLKKVEEILDLGIEWLRKELGRGETL